MPDEFYAIKTVKFFNFTAVLQPQYLAVATRMYSVARPHLASPTLRRLRSLAAEEPRPLGSRNLLQASGPEAILILREDLDLLDLVCVSSLSCRLFWYFVLECVV